MYHTDKLSVCFETADQHHERTLKEFPLPPNNNGPEDITRVIISIKPRTALRVTLVLHEGFNFFGSDGLRVTIAIGRQEYQGAYSPDNAQSWWVPRKDLTYESGKETSWEEFWTWSSNSVSRGRRRITAPAPPSGDFESAPCETWAEMMNAAQGCIAVYVTRGILSRKTKRGLKRCTTDPPESKSFAESAHPIRAEWFRPLSGKAGEIHIFEAANMDQNSLKAMGLGTFPDEPEDDNGDPDAERRALQGTVAGAPTSRQRPDNTARSATRDSQPKWTHLQYEPIPEPASPHQQAPKTYRTGRKRSPDAPHAEGSGAFKKNKSTAFCETTQMTSDDYMSHFFSGPDFTDDEADDNDDEQVILDNTDLLTQAPNASAPRPEHTALPADSHRKHAPEALTDPSGPAEKASQAVTGKDKQQAEKLSKMRIELQEAQAKILMDKIEHEVKFGGGVDG